MDITKEKTSLNYFTALKGHACLGVLQRMVEKSEFSAKNALAQMGVIIVFYTPKPHNILFWIIWMLLFLSAISLQNCMANPGILSMTVVL